MNETSIQQLKFCRVRDVKAPERGTPLSAGIDFFIPADSPVIYLAPGEDILIPSGIKVKIPHGYALIAFNKSSIASSYGAQAKAGKNPSSKSLVSALQVGACIVDEDYQGEIHISLSNIGSTEVQLVPNQKIVQFMLVPTIYCQVKEVAPSELFDTRTTRGSGNFGSTTK